ncbi:MAG: hypothetical protein LBF58_05365 [Deltaproteobacteria bacterium]|nr:hypothetical protein [Deltaproteobacteria bacterium]
MAAQTWGGNRTRAAEILGLTRRALITKLALYNLDGHRRRTPRHT